MDLDYSLPNWTSNLGTLTRTEDRRSDTAFPGALAITDAKDFTIRCRCLPSEYFCGER